MVDTEIWRFIPGFPVYRASNKGRLMTYNWRNTGRIAVMKPAKSKDGYMHTIFVKDGKNIPIKAHRMVAMAFIDNPGNKPQVNHKNGIKDDNRVENLEWVTARENFDHSVENGLQPGLFKKGHIPINKGLNSYSKKEHIAINEYIPICGEKIGTSKLTEQQVIDIRSKFKKRVYTREMLAQEYGVKASCIKDIILRKSWKHL